MSIELHPREYCSAHTGRDVATLRSGMGGSLLSEELADASELASM